MIASLHERSLLFGLVALHHRLVARPALAAWRTDNARPLSQILLEQQALTAKEVEVLVRVHGEQAIVLLPALATGRAARPRFFHRL